MLSPSQFREIVSGRHRGMSAGLLRAVLRLAEVPYSTAMRLRNLRYNCGWAEVQRVEIPVVSVGNLTLGGTGKTPMVAWLARWLRNRGVRVTLVSRGYGAEAGVRNDEALELELQLPDVPHLQNRDRVAASRLAIEEFESEMILLDDGFQHRRLARDLDIVLVDALEPFGFEHVFPRGTLREPLSGIRRAQVAVLTRADLLGPDQRRALQQRVARYAPQIVWTEASHQPQSLVSSDGGEASLDALRDVRVAAFCGIGNPAGFRHTLSRLGCQVVDFREFEDHHAYNRQDIEGLHDWIRGMKVDQVLCTRKDLVKVGLERLGDRPLWAVAIGMKFLNGQEALEAALQPLLPG